MATILCIDDWTYALAARVQWLRAHGHVVVVTSSLESALETLVTNPVDAALLDCHEDAAGRIVALLKCLRPGLPIMVLASYCGLPCHLKGLVTDCVPRDEAPAGLLHRLEKILRKAIPGEAA